MTGHGAIVRRKVTFSLNEFTLEMVQAAAARAGMSLSAWLAEAARHEAVRQGVGTEWGDPEADAIADEADLAAAEADLRATG